MRVAAAVMVVALVWVVIGRLNDHSFIRAISISPRQVHYYYSEALPTTALILCQS